MRIRLVSTLMLPAFAIMTDALSHAASGQSSRCTVPDTRRGGVVDTYHGREVADPYRWLEEVDTEETAKWVEAQNCATVAFLERIPERAPLRDRLTQIWDYPKYGTPFKEGGRYFFFKNDGLQNQSVLYTQDALNADPRTLLDPNTLSADGTVALSTLSISDDGRYVMYGLAEGGSDWNEFRVRDIVTAQDLSDRLQWIKFSGASWTADNRGFFYSRYPEPTGAVLRGANRDHKLYYHVLGTDQDRDVLVYERPDEPEWGFAGSVTDDGRYLVVSVWLGTDRRNRVHYLDLARPDQPVVRGDVVRLLDAFDAGYGFVGNDGPVFYFWTDLHAPRGRLIAIDTRNPDQHHWREVIPESDDVLSGVQIINNTFVASYLHDAHSRVRFYAMDGTATGELAFPTIGSIGGMSGDRADPEMFYAFTSYLYPTTIFRYDFRDGQSQVFKAPEIDFDASGYETRQVFYHSKDGTRIPMFVTHRRGIALDGSNPTYLYAYGGFNISITPSFSISMIPWLEMGGVYAVPNLRGGGEYGEEWHQAGMLDRKQNVFDDFIAAAEYLIAEGYTSPEKLAIAGASNGGLLVGAVMTQRPDLVGAALPAVGVMDMLRFHRFTIGWAWVTEYGSADSTNQFPFLRAYSPLHNIQSGTTYPPTLITTADHDDRVVPGHSFKFAAALQRAQAGPAPVLIRIETRAGHGAGKPTSKIIDELADQWAFLVEVLHMRRPGT
ncbi:MAG TPA: prolyl oligopeptidase family serine peptidase [Gemmatimonadales bacterium]